MAKRKQQEEPQGPGISGLFNVPPTYYLPGTIGDVGAVAIDYPTMRAEPWNQTAAPIPTPSSPQGEIFAAPPGADAPFQFAIGQEWKDLYDLMATETDVYRKYLQDTHQLADTYFPPIVATNQVPARLGEVAAWYDPNQKKVYVPLRAGGYDAGEYMDVGPIAVRYKSSAGDIAELQPAIRSARNPKNEINIRTSPIPHEIGHYYDWTGAPDDQEYDTMSWSYYPELGLNPWDYILRNMAGSLRPEQAPTGSDDQSWFHSDNPRISMPSEMFAEYFGKALTSGIALDENRLNEIYGGKSPVTVWYDSMDPATPQPVRNEVAQALALKTAEDLADKLNSIAKSSPDHADSREHIVNAVSMLGRQIPAKQVQRAMQPALTEEAKQFLYWLFTRGYTPR